MKHPSLVWPTCYLLGALLLAPATQADTLVSTGNVADTYINGTSSATTLVFAGTTDLRAGVASAGATDIAAVYVFALPTLPAGHTVSSANLQFIVRQETLFANSFTGSLYGVRSSSSSTVVAGDHYTGPYDSDSGATGLQEILLTNGMASASTVNTDATGDAALATWLQGEYDGGAVAGDYVFLRINHDNPASTQNGLFQLEAADSSGKEPLLTFETAASGGSGPRPAEIGFLQSGLSAALLSPTQN